MQTIKKHIVGAFSAISKTLPLSVKTTLTRAPIFSGIFRKLLNAAIEDGLSVVTITAGGLAGMKMQLKMKTEKSRWLGTYEPDMEKAISELVKPGDVVYDVGGNIGYISLLFSKAVGQSGQVFCFEPLPENVTRIQTNLSLNRVTNVQVVAAAVIDSDRDVQFLQHESVGMGKVEGSAGRDDQTYTGHLTVKGICLDNLAQQEKVPEPDVIKLDIEGGEVLALPGMKNLLARKKPILMMELHGPESEEVAWNTLMALGYHLYRMGHENELVHSKQQLGWKAYILALP